MLILFKWILHSWKTRCWWWIMELFSYFNNRRFYVVAGTAVYLHVWAWLLCGDRSWGHLWETLQRQTEKLVHNAGTSVDRCNANEFYIIQGYFLGHINIQTLQRQVLANEHRWSDTQLNTPLTFTLLCSVSSLNAWVN